MEDWAYLILFVAGMSFLVWITNSLAITGISASFNETSLATPDCDIGGLDAPIDALICVFGSLVFFFSLASISSSYIIVNFIFIGLTVGVVFIVLKLIRGS